MLDRPSQSTASLISWPPPYHGIVRARQARLKHLRRNPGQWPAAIAYYRTRPVEFVDHWCDTFDPRNAGTGKPTRMPFILFPRQKELVYFFQACLDAPANGLVEKCRDMGATWDAIVFSVWLFLFVPGSSIGWGSRKGASVDRIGDMSSIFEKIRWELLTLPRELWPEDFAEDDMAYMKITSTSTNSSITGESGDDIGRGGRTLIYFKDESAHYEHPEAIEAALSDNARVQIDISSVNGLGNVFHRKREAGVEWDPRKGITRGKTNVFVMDWRDHPGKSQDWYDAREADAVDNGLLHVFRQEIDRSYDASVEGVIVPPAWVRSAIDAHLKIDGMLDGPSVAALDVADGGGDRNALAQRRGVVLEQIDEWGERDTRITARRAVDMVAPLAPIQVQYDCIGVGSGVKAETNGLMEEGVMPRGVKFVSWDAGAGPQNPDEHVVKGDKQTPLNKDFYANLKAQGWWQLRRRFEKTHRMIQGEAKYPPDELISLSSTLPRLRTLQKELSQPTAGKSARMKLLVNKAPEGTRSPNEGDAVMMCYWPIKKSSYDATLDWVM